MNKQRLIGIDYGTKRIGVALSDLAGQFALPHSVILNDEMLLNEIEKIAKENDVTEIVLGESRDYKGEPNKVLAQSMEFKKTLEEKGYKVTFEPEFMTSTAAARFQGKNDMHDASAAALILQSYLDRK